VSEPASEARFITETGTAAEIANLAEPVLEGLGFRLVLVRIIGGQGPIIEIMAERPDGTMSIEDCRIVSQSLSPVLDVHDPMPQSSYRLQISSPGIDRPLVRPADFDQWAGYEAKVEMKELISGRRRFRGVLEGFEAGEARIEVDLGDAGRQVLGLPIALIADAKLVLTDELVRESLRRAKRTKVSTAPGEVAGAPPKTRAVTAQRKG
jgi:ribosome maturation factor RimP